MFFFRVSTNQKSGKCHELPRKSIHFLTPLRRWREGGRTGEEREGEREREAGREGGARAKPGNQLVGEGRPKWAPEVKWATLITANLVNAMAKMMMLVSNPSREGTMECVACELQHKIKQ